MSSRNIAIEDPTVTMNDIGGLETVSKELLQRAKSTLEDQEDAQIPKGGVLLYGPPGCGKTVLVKAIANKMEANLIIIKGLEMLCESDVEVYVQDVFGKVRSAVPCILFLDGMESFQRVETSSVDFRGIKHILTEMDEISSNKNIFFIGATTRPEIIDSAFLRPGHLDHLIYIPLPDDVSRVAILQAKLETIPQAKDVDIPYLASQTTGFSGADLTEICQRACKLAIRETLENQNHQRNLSVEINQDDEDTLPEVLQRHFVEAMKFTRRSVSESEALTYEMFKEAL